MCRLKTQGLPLTAGSDINEQKTHHRPKIDYRISCISPFLVGLCFRHGMLYVIARYQALTTLKWACFHVWHLQNVNEVILALLKLQNEKKNYDLFSEVCVGISKTCLMSLRQSRRKYTNHILYPHKMVMITLYNFVSIKYSGTHATFNAPNIAYACVKS